MRIDAVERLAYWKEREAIARDSVNSWQKSGDRMSPGALKRASDWLKMTTQLVRGWQTEVDKLRTRKAA